MSPLIELTLVVALVVLLVVLFLLSVRPSKSTREQLNGEAAPGGRLQQMLNFYPRAMRQAGFNPETIGVSYWSSKLFLAAVLPLIGSQFYQLDGRLLLSDPWTVYLIVIGFYLPDLWIFRLRAKRRHKIRNSLSFFLDLVVSLLHSGLSLERAFLRAGREGYRESHPLADEVMILGQELDMGKDRNTAFYALAERTGVIELRAVAASVRMGLSRGASVTETLEAQADLLRAKRRERAFRRVYRAAVVSLVPVFLCGVPVFVVVVYFPAVLQIFETFRMLRMF